MPIQLPKVLKNFNVFVDGVGQAGIVNEIQLPKINVKTEEHRAGGMDLPVKLDMGMEALEAILTFGELAVDMLKLFGLLDKPGVPITVRGAMQAQGSTEVTPVVVAMAGGWSAIDMGTWKAGDPNTTTYTVALTYYKLTIGGTDIIEIDVLNMVRKINGVDALEGQRTALGL